MSTRDPFRSGTGTPALIFFSIEKRPAFKIDRPEIEPAVLLVEGGVKQAELAGLELYMS